MSDPQYPYYGPDRDNAGRPAGPENVVPTPMPAAIPSASSPVPTVLSAPPEPPEPAALPAEPYTATLSAPPEPAPAPPPPPPSFPAPDSMEAVGARLAQLREARGWSIGDISVRLKVSPAKLRALELGDLSQMPDTVFVFGVVRSYARMLDVDAGPFVQVVRRERGEPHTDLSAMPAATGSVVRSSAQQQAAQAQRGEPEAGGGTRRAPWLWGAVAGVALVAVVGLALWRVGVFQRGASPFASLGTGAATTGAASEPVVQVTPDATVTQPADAAENASPASMLTAPTSQTMPPSSQVTQIPDATPAPQVADPVPVQPQTQAPTAGAGAQVAATPPSASAVTSRTKAREAARAAASAAASTRQAAAQTQLAQAAASSASPRPTLHLRAASSVSAQSRATAADAAALAQPPAALYASTGNDSAALAQPPVVTTTTAANTGDASSIMISASQDTWVSVRQKNGKEVFSGIVHGNDTRAINGVAPLKVTVGNKSAIESMTLDGQQVDASKYTSAPGNVAHFVVP